MYDSITLLYSRNWHNTVNQLQFFLKLKNKRTQKTLLLGTLSNLELKNKWFSLYTPPPKKGASVWAAFHVFEVSDSHDV